MRQLVEPVLVIVPGLIFSPYRLPLKKEPFMADPSINVTDGCKVLITPALIFIHPPV